VVSKEVQEGGKRGGGHSREGSTPCSNWLTVLGKWCKERVAGLGGSLAYSGGRGRELEGRSQKRGAANRGGEEVDFRRILMPVCPGGSALFLFCQYLITLEKKAGRRKDAGKGGDTCSCSAQETDESGVGAARGF